MENTQMNAESNLPGGAVTPVVSRRTPPAGLLALLLAVVALLVSAWLFMDQRRVVAAAGTQALDVQRATVRVEAVSRELSDVRAEFHRLAANESDLAQRLAGMRAALEELTRAQGNVDFALAEVEYLLILAEQRLVLMQDADTAAAALESAQRRLQSLDAPGLDSVRAQVAVDLLRLRNVPRIDFNAWYRDLGMLAARVERMPLRAETAAPAPEESASVPQGWRGILHSMWLEVRRLVVITPRREGLDPLPGDRVLLGQSLQLRIETARVALLRRDGAAVHEAAGAALDWLTRWFDPTHHDVRAVREKLQALASLDPAPTLPEVNSSLETLRALVHERATPGLRSVVPPEEAPAQEGPAETTVP